jgi:hypothetical protein
MLVTQGPLAAVGRRRNLPGLQRSRRLRAKAFPGEDAGSRRVELRYCRRGGSVAAVAGRHGVARGLSCQCLKPLRGERMPGLSLKEPEAAVVFAPVSIVPEGSMSHQPAPAPSPPRPPSRPARY